MSPDTASTASAVAPAGNRAMNRLTSGGERFTQARVERLLERAVAFGCTVIGVQALLYALGDQQVDPSWRLMLTLAVFVPLATMSLACAVGVGVRLAAGAFAIVVPLALIAWPTVTAGGRAFSDEPWIWYLLNVATAAAVMAFRMPLQIAWAIVIPVLYTAVRLVQIEGSENDANEVVYRAVFILILAGVMIALAWMLRATAIDIDRARREAVASYAAAAAEAAAETERIAVAGLMHDSVLAALIAAERADTPREQALAASMAREALTRLANADHDSGEGPDEPVPPGEIVAGLQTVVNDFGLTAGVDADIAVFATPLPGRVARALTLAATQAITNAVQHAHGVGLTVAVRADRAGIRVRVSDGGAGFDPGAVGDDRLGIRGSIAARTAAVGGRAQVHTDPTGTIVTLEWEHPR
ncbi:MAG: ATP-binding protein [Microbacterium sp.]